ncbi:hypothetical protein JCM3774_003063 [Rhodotorula dairenensis]
MAQAKRATEQPPPTRKSKKPRTNRKRKAVGDEGQHEEEHGAAPLGSTSLLAQHARAHAKDETELELEEAVFGRRAGTRDADVYGAAASTTTTRAADSDAGELDYELDEEEDDDDDETGLERLRDDNLFFVDVPPTASTSAGLGQGLDAGEEDDDDDASSEDGLDSDADRGAGAERALAEQAKAPALRSRNLRQAAWFDPADEQLQISLVGQKRLRKLRDAEGEDVVNGLEYETRLRKQ